MDKAQLTPIVEQAMRGDEGATHALFDAVARQVVYMCIKLLGNRQDGEDAAQLVLLKIYNTISRLRDPASFIAWMNRVVYTTCRDYRRHSQLHSGFLPIEGVELDVMEDRREFLPEEFAENAEKRELVLREVDRLPEKYRQVLLLY